MLKDDDKWNAMADARIRHEALNELIFLTDKQALSLLGLYLTAGVAAISAAFAGLGPNAIIPLPVSAALGGAAVLLFIGCLFCMSAMQAAAVGLPGRDADFWKWADPCAPQGPRKANSNHPGIKKGRVGFCVIPAQIL